MSEIADLVWRDLQPRTDGGQVTVFGKGSKTRTVLLPTSIWRELLRFRRHAPLDAPVFASSRGGGHLHPTAIERIVTKAAARAGLEVKVSPTGCATATPLTRSSAARRSTWSRRRWATPLSRPPASTSTRARRTRARVTWRFR